LEQVVVVAVTAAEAVVEVMRLSSPLRWRLEVISLQLELVEQAARQVCLEVLAVNQDSPQLELIFVHLEEVEVQQTD
jgi:hypothetical protein